MLMHGGSFAVPLVSEALCNAMAAVARRLCTQHVYPSTVLPLLVCRLIALNKNPGVRPIGRIVAKATLFVLKGDIQEAAGSNQLRGGQVAGIELAVNTVRQMMKTPTPCS